MQSDFLARHFIQNQMENDYIMRVYGLPSAITTPAHGSEFVKRFNVEAKRIKTIFMFPLMRAVRCLLRIISYVRWKHEHSPCQTIDQPVTGCRKRKGTLWWQPPFWFYQFGNFDDGDGNVMPWGDDGETVEL